MANTYAQCHGTDQYNVTRPALTEWTKVMIASIRSEFRQFAKRSKMRAQWPSVQEPMQFGMFGLRNRHSDLDMLQYQKDDDFIPIYSPYRPASPLLNPSFSQGIGGLLLTEAISHGQTNPRSTGSAIESRLRPLDTEINSEQRQSPLTSVNQSGELPSPSVRLHADRISPTVIRSVDRAPPTAGTSADRVSPTVIRSVDRAPPTTPSLVDRVTPPAPLDGDRTSIAQAINERLSLETRLSAESILPIVRAENKPETIHSPSSNRSLTSGGPANNRRSTSPFSGTPSPRLPGGSLEQNVSTSSDDEDLPDGDYYVNEDGTFAPVVDVQTLNSSDITWITNSDGSQLHLGTGTFGTVKGANLKMEDGRVVKVAVKKFFSKDLTSFSMEARLQSLLNGTGVFPIFHGVVQLTEGQESVLCQVSELFAGGTTVRDLLQEPSGLSNTGWVEVARQITTGLQTIHQHGVIYNDLKADNILVEVSADSRPLIKFIDLGVSSFYEGKIFELTEEERYFYPHLAPEVKAGEETTIASDIWSIGILIARMATEAEVDGLWFAANMACNQNPKQRSSLVEIAASLQSIKPG